MVRRKCVFSLRININALLHSRIIHIIKRSNVFFSIFRHIEFIRTTQHNSIEHTAEMKCRKMQPPATHHFLFIYVCLYYIIIVFFPLFTKDDKRQFLLFGERNSIRNFRSLNGSARVCVHNVQRTCVGCASLKTKVCNAMRKMCTVANKRVSDRRHTIKTREIENDRFLLWKAMRKVSESFRISRVPC